MKTDWLTAIIATLSNNKMCLTENLICLLNEEGMKNIDPVNKVLH